MAFREKWRSEWRNFFAVANGVIFTQEYFAKVRDFENKESHGKEL